MMEQVPRIENLPPPGLPNSLGAYMDATIDMVRPPRFTEYLRAHFLANLPMHADSQVSIIIGSYALFPTEEIRLCLDAVEIALASEQYRTSTTQRDYELLRIGLLSLLSGRS